MYQILILLGVTRNSYGSDSRRNMSTGSGQHSSRGNQQNHQNEHHSNYRDYRYDQQRGPQFHARFDERCNQQYSPPAFLPTPSLNSSFPEALNRSLLQIAENQSRKIDVMKATQEAQAEAYREMSKTNKMRDDDALFQSIPVYDGSDPSKFETWMDSIDQATRIAGHDLRKELMKKSDGVVCNTISMMEGPWSDDAVIAKLCQDFSSLSTMNRA